MKKRINVVLMLCCLWGPAFVYAQSITVPQVSSGHYKLLVNEPHQRIWGLGFEIQSDAIVSGNKGLPEEFTSVPHDLLPAERDRFSRDMLKGFRYCRIAGGLYLRGTTPDKKELRGRWIEQMPELNAMMRGAGIEGVSLEYWSPAPYWKANGKYTGHDSTVNKLKCFAPNFKYDTVYHGDTIAFLKDFARSLVNDISYLNKNGLKVLYWGLQNEPPVNANYSSCVYKAKEYYLAFKTIAPFIRAFDPKITIISDSWGGQTDLGLKIAADPEARKYVDAWVWHRIGRDANDLIDHQQTYTSNTFGKPVYQNEYEYQGGKATPKRSVNTVQNLMNWLTFVDSPTWYWIHALKPVRNSEANGYALGFWQPQTQEKTSAIEKGHWIYNDYNFNPIVGFLKYMPWNSVRYAVEEDEVRHDNRIMSFKTPAGKWVLVVTNRSGADFTFNIDVIAKKTFRVVRYTALESGTSHQGVYVDNAAGPKLQVTLPDNAWEFLIEQ